MPGLRFACTPGRLSRGPSARSPLHDLAAAASNFLPVTTTRLETERREEHDGTHRRSRVRNVSVRNPLLDFLSFFLLVLLCLSLSLCLLPPPHPSASRSCSIAYSQELPKPSKCLSRLDCPSSTHTLPEALIQRPTVCDSTLQAAAALRLDLACLPTTNRPHPRDPPVAQRSSCSPNAGTAYVADLIPPHFFVRCDWPVTYLHGLALHNRDGGPPPSPNALCPAAAAAPRCCVLKTGNSAEDDTLSQSPMPNRHDTREISPWQLFRALFHTPRLASPRPRGNRDSFPGDAKPALWLHRNPTTRSGNCARELTIE